MHVPLFIHYHSFCVLTKKALIRLWQCISSLVAYKFVVPRKACVSVLFLLCFRARLFINALWSPARKGLASWLSFVMSNCVVVTFPLVSWVRCGA